MKRPKTMLDAILIISIPIEMLPINEDFQVGLEPLLEKAIIET